MVQFCISVCTSTNRAFAANFKCTFDLNENNSGSTEFCNFKIEDENVQVFPQNMNEGSLKILNDLEEHHAEPHILAFSSTSSAHVCPTAACQCSLLLGAVHPAY